MLWDARSIFKNSIGFGKAPAPLSFCRTGSYPPPFSGGNGFFFFSGCYCLVDEGERNIELCLCHRRNELQFSVPLTLAALHSPGEVQSPFCPQENPAGIHGFKHMEEEGLGTGCDPV